MALKYYYDLMSQPCRAVYMFLKLNKVPFEDKALAVRKGENLTEEYAKINPFKLIPGLQDGDFCLTESIAMVDYITNTRKVADNWYPSDPKKRAKVNEYLHWQHVNTRLQCSMVFRNLLIIPRAKGIPVDEGKVERGREGVREVVHHLDTYFLRNSPFIFNENISAADLFGVCELMQLYPVFEEGLYESNPRVKAWFDRVKAETNPVFDEAHKVSYMVREVYKGMKEKA